jgi:hypothetical protein
MFTSNNNVLGAIFFKLGEAGSALEMRAEKMSKIKMKK